MVVQHRSSNDPTVTRVGSGITGKVASRLSMRLDGLPLRLYPRRGSTTWSVGWHNLSILSNGACRSADLIHLHWIGGGFIACHSLPRLKKPLVWTLHDAWPFTGGCHFFGSCLGYTRSCGRCPQLGSMRSWDLSRLTRSWKGRSWKSLDLCLVSPSNWLAQRAASSSLFSDTRIEVIPLGLDLSLFKPIEQSFARTALNLPLDKRIVVMGAVGSTVDPRKGFHHLVQATRLMASQGWAKDTEVVVFGSSQPPSQPDSGVRTTFLGVLRDELSLSLAYSAADVFVAPSLQENFCQTVLEAMACGTPAVAFRVGGMPDLIEHQRTGYLARAFEVNDLAKGLCWVMEDRMRQKALAIRSRQTVEANFSLQKAADRYKALYEEFRGNQHR